LILSGPNGDKLNSDANIFPDKKIGDFWSISKLGYQYTPGTNDPKFSSVPHVLAHPGIAMAPTHVGTPAIKFSAVEAKMKLVPVGGSVIVTAHSRGSQKELGRTALFLRKDPETCPNCGTVESVAFDIRFDGSQHPDVRTGDDIQLVATSVANGKLIAQELESSHLEGIPVLVAAV
jgi:hypothetical protein